MKCAYTCTVCLYINCTVVLSVQNFVLFLRKKCAFNVFVFLMALC